MKTSLKALVGSRIVVAIVDAAGKTLASASSTIKGMKPEASEKGNHSLVLDAGPFPDVAVTLASGSEHPLVIARPQAWLATTPRVRPAKPAAITA